MYVHMYNVEKRIHLLWFFKPFPNLSWCNNPQSSAFVGCYTFAGCGNGHSLSVMSETNSRVISLTSRRSRGAKLLRQRGVATVAPTRTAILVPDPRRAAPGLGIRIGHVSKGENLRGECSARKDRLIVGIPYVHTRRAAPPWNNTKFTGRRAMVSELSR